MKPRFPLTGAERSAPETGGASWDDILPTSSLWREDRACCCPAPPVVRVIMRPTLERPHSVDLLLCGHHYRVSRQALTDAGAHMENMPGKADAAAAALLETAHLDHAEVR